MRDLLSKLDRILLEETTLQDLKKEPMAKDPVIAKAIKDKEQEENKEESSDKKRDTSWMRDPKDPESRVPAIFRKEREAGKSAGRKTVDALNKQAGAEVWRTPRESFEIGDAFDISISEDFEIGAEIVDILEDGVVVELDDIAIDYLSKQGFTFEEGELVEEKQKGLDGKACWKGYRRMGTKMKGGKRVDNCVKVGEDSDVEESGLQYYTGKKKYGKEGMAALAAAGRKGASEEELGRIKDKYKKEGLGEGSKIKWYEKDDSDVTVTIDRESHLVRNTPDGPVLYAEDVEGYWTDYDKEGWLDVEINVSTGEKNVRKVDLGRNSGPEDDWNDDAVNEFADELLSKVRKSYGTTWEEIKDEATGGATVEKESMIEADGNLNMLIDKTVKALMVAKDKGMRSLPEPAYADDQDLIEFMEKHLPNIMNKVPDDSWNDFADAVFDKFFNASGKDNLELEAKYQGREVPLGKPMQGDVKKSKVYVKNPQGNVVKVNFGDKKMKIKKSNPKRRRSFRARHNCANPGPRHKARYWSCRAW